MFYVHVNWPNHRVRVHREDCPHIRVHPGAGEANDDYVGPMGLTQARESALETLAQHPLWKDRESDCWHCGRAGRLAS